MFKLLDERIDSETLAAYESQRAFEEISRYSGLLGACDDRWKWYAQKHFATALQLSFIWIGKE